MTTRSRWLLRAAAALVLLGALVVGVGFYYFFAPLRRVSTPAWLAGHSRHERCDEVVRSAARIGWTHDETLLMVECDESVVRRIMERIEREDPHGSMALHLGWALQGLTNQDIAADDTAAWLRWWKANQGRSQDEWIRDGFCAGGLDLHQPPTPAERVVLLENLSLALGRRLTRGWFYNSYRLLRDSGYVPWREAKLADLGSPPSEAALEGLVRYTGWLATEGPEGNEEDLPMIATKELARRIALALAAATLVGFALFGLSLRPGREPGSTVR